MKELEKLQKYVAKELKKIEWRGLYDGSSGETMDDGVTMGKIKALHSVAKKIGVKVYPLPDFYLSMEEYQGSWNAIEGFTAEPEEEW